MEEFLETSQDLLFLYAPKVITALLILFVGLYVIKIIIKSSRKIMQKRGVDVTLQKFLGNLLGWILKVLLFITVISQLGIATTSFAAIIAAAGLAIGLALQGSLGNFAGGVLDFTFGVGYDSDIRKTKEIIFGVINNHPLVLKEPATAVNLSELGDSSINFFTRAWVKKEDYWAVKFDIIEQTKEAFDAAGIDIPYPHRVNIEKKA